MPYFAEQDTLLLHVPKTAGKFTTDFISKVLDDATVRGEKGMGKLRRLCLEALNAHWPTNVLESPYGDVIGRYWAPHLSLQEWQLIVAPYHLLTIKSVIGTHRNPFTRALSLYAHWDELTPKSTPADVSCFLTRFCRPPFQHHGHYAHARTQTSYFRNIDGHLRPDILFSFESLDQDLQFWADCHHAEVEVPTRNEGDRTSQFFDLLSDEKLQRTIQGIYEEDFETFAYPERFSLENIAPASSKTQKRSS